MMQRLGGEATNQRSHRQHQQQQLQQQQASDSPGTAKHDGDIITYT